MKVTLPLCSETGQDHKSVKTAATPPPRLCPVRTSPKSGCRASASMTVSRSEPVATFLADASIPACTFPCTPPTVNGSYWLVKSWGVWLLMKWKAKKRLNRNLLLSSQISLECRGASGQPISIERRQQRNEWVHSKKVDGDSDVHQTRM